jgi:hypothetical protein
MLQNFLIPWNISFTFGNQNLILADATCTWYNLVIKYVSDLQRERFFSPESSCLSENLAFHQKKPNAD